jgi:uncharacterized membrane protein
MTKIEFLHELGAALLGLPQEDIERWLEYYTEMLEDRIEDGMSEKEAVTSLGDPTKIVKEILAQTPFTKLIKNKVKPKRKLQVWEIILICVGSPIWSAFAISAVAVFFSVIVSLWACIVSLWAVEFSLAACGIAGVIGTAFFLATGAVHQGLFLLGCGLVCAGMAYFGWCFCKQLSVLLAKLCKLFLLFVKSLFVEKEGEK